MTVEVRPLTPEDEHIYRQFGGKGPLPVFVGEVDGLRAYRNTLDQVLARCRQGLAHRSAVILGEFE